MSDGPPDVVTALGEVLDDAKAGRTVAILVFAVDAQTRTAVYMGGQVVDEELHAALIMQMVEYINDYKKLMDEDDEDPN